MMKDYINFIKGKGLVFGIASILTVCGMPYHSIAQDMTDTAMPATTAVQNDQMPQGSDDTAIPMLKVSSLDAPMDWALEKSLFMTPNQITSILQARRGLIVTEEAYDENNQETPVSNGPRILTLAGLVYVNRNDWTIWFNDERVTPANIPDQIIDLTVKRDRIHLKWLDIEGQRIVALTLRPHESYHLDTELLYPGT